MRTIPPSELIINDDGTIFHLHLRPEQIADIIILVGDPARVDMIASRFESVECRVENREFRTVTGYYNDCRMSVISTGIGVGNVDICVSELDALANIDFESRQVREIPRELTLVRLGTSGGLQDDICIGDFIFARTSIGFDALLSYYDNYESVCDKALESAFMEHTHWSEKFPRVYAVDSDEQLFELFADSTREGITVASPGFYAPQGRFLRLAPADLGLNDRMMSFDMDGRKVTNYEMESSVLAGLAKLMGHRAATICVIIAQRAKTEMDTDYRPFVEEMIEMALKKLSTL